MNCMKLANLFAMTLIEQRGAFLEQNYRRIDKIIHTMAWGKISWPKCEGVLGIRKAEENNATFLEKRG